MKGGYDAEDELPDAVARAIAEREKRVMGLKSQLEAMRTSPAVIEGELRALEDAARGRLAPFRTMLDRNPQEASKVMEGLLDGPLTFKPIETKEGSRYLIEGSASGGAFFSAWDGPNPGPTAGETSLGTCGDPDGSLRDLSISIPVSLVARAA